MASIGIKIANGEFYSIFDENSVVKKRLVLTTVHDNQRSVQIDLYKSFTKTMKDALYIGSLVVENINPNPKGDPSVEMVVSSTNEGEIIADAVDLDASANGEHQILTVSLKSLDEDNREYEIPDFELEQHEAPPSGLYEQASEIGKRGKSFPRVVAIVIGLVIIIACLALWFFLFRNKGVSGQQTPLSENPTISATPLPTPVQPAAPAQAPAQPVTPPPAQPVAPAQAPVQPVTPPPPPVIEAPPVVSQPVSPAKPAASRERTQAPVWSYKVPAAIPPGGVSYKIRWGDTLWDIAGAFYRDPWQYHRIVRDNRGNSAIITANHIISGKNITIKPRN
ncbi:hypothetical protein AGMMS49579_12870 [Spirochaetia bacterium]|nr:hypothetical protein AGMMS49579_12870 [Spirochaetia bacterium]